MKRLLATSGFAWVVGTIAVAFVLADGWLLRSVIIDRQMVNATADLSNGLRILEIRLSELESGFKSSTGPDQDAWQRFQSEYRSWSDRIRLACPPDATHGDAVAHLDAAIGRLARLQEQPPAAMGRTAEERELAYDRELARVRQSLQSVASLVRQRITDLSVILLRKTNLLNAAAVLASVLVVALCLLFRRLQLDIARRRRAEQAWRESESRWRALVENLPFECWACNREGVILVQNSMSAKRHGAISRLKPNGKPRPDPTLDVWQQSFARALRGEIVNEEVTIEDEGLARDFLNVIAPVRDGEVTAGVVGVAIDITEHRRTLEALDASQRRYEAMAQLSPVGIFRTDPTWKRIYANARLRDMTGIKEDPFDGARWASAVHPDDYAWVEKAWQQAMATGDPLQIEHRLRHPDGDILWVQSQIVAVRDASNTITGYIGAITDITERRLTEQVIRERDELLTAIFDASRDGIIVEQSEHIAYTNRAFISLLGYSHERELLGRPVTVFQAPEQKEQLAEYSKQRLEGRPTPGVYPFRGVRKDGSSIELEASVSVAPIAGRPSIMAIFRDLTERRQLQVQLMQSQKMEALGRLARGIAHDFNNLLTVILGYVELLGANANLDTAEKDCILEIEHAGRRAATLTGQLLAFSRRHMLSPVILSVNEVISSLTNMLRRVIGEDIELVTTLDPDVHVIRADRGQLEQALLNLAVNARDAMPTGGKLTIETSNLQLLESPPGAELAPGSFALIQIADTGPGMDVSATATLFEPFLEARGGRLGLGLAIVYGVVKQAGGHIEADSDGQGTTFRIYWPCLTNADAAGQSASPRADLRGHETILLVEDDDAVRNLGRESLRKFGYKVIEARNGAEGLDRAMGCQGAIDLLITDVIMPRMNGGQLATRIRQLRPALRVLYQSAHTGEVLLQQGISYDDTCFLQKPFTQLELARRVRMLLDSPVSSRS
jgi:two-component system cell cycle sensor histidine kinase/response regulator CckA